MGTNLGPRLLDTKVSADIYARNPFRWLALPATADSTSINRAAQRLRLRAHKQSPVAPSIASGYDDIVPIQPSELIDALVTVNDPRKRLVYELFWPASEQTLQPYLEAQSMLGGLPLQNTGGEPSSTDHPDAMHAHARAVALDNVAISLELRGDPAQALLYWQKSWEAWTRALNDETWWSHIGSRIRALRDPRLSLHDLETLRKELPQAILGFRMVFIGQKHGEMSLELCRAHLSAIRRAPLNRRNRSTVYRDARRRAASACVASISTRLDAATPCTSSVDFRKRFYPLIEEAVLVADAASENVSSLRDELIGVFDELAGKILSGVKQLTGRDQRDMLFNARTAQILLGLPLSQDIARQAEELIATAVKALYGEFTTETHADPTRCWFLPHLPADPESSIVLDIHKVEEITPIGAQCAKSKLLIPRSKRAKLLHDGAALEPKWSSTAEISAEERELITELETIDRAARLQREEIEQLRNQKITELRSELQQNIDSEVSPSCRDIFRRDLARITEIEANCAARIVDLDRDLARRTSLLDCKLGQCKATLESLPCRLFGAWTWRRFAVFVVTVVGGAAVLATGLLGAGVAGIAALTLLVAGSWRLRKSLAAQAALEHLQLGRNRTELELKYRAELDALHAIVDVETSRIGTQWSSVLPRVREYKTQFEARREELEAHFRRQVEALEQQTQRARTEILPRLEALSEAKPLSEQIRFPYVVAAFAAGFETGTPDTSKLNDLIRAAMQKFLASLEPAEKSILQKLAENISNESWNLLVRRLSRMSGIERRRALNELLS